MKLLACALFIVAWTTSCHALIVPEDCNDARIEKDAGVALNLINKHRKEGYVFALFRVADAQVQHLENASIAYLTLDVLETQCPVISRKHWSSCEQRPFLSITDLGQCKAVVYINELSQRKLLYAYNCTISPVPPKLYECKRCPVRITVLEDTERHTEEANQILEEYRLGSNESNYFKVEKVQKVFSAVASRTVFIVEFTIKETRCPRNTDPTSVSQCEFLPDRKANLGFCIGRIVKETGAPDVVAVDSCAIYNTQNLSTFHHHHHHDHPHFHHDSGEDHHHCNVTGHECRHPLHKHPHHHHRRRPHHHHHHHRHHHHNHSHSHGHLLTYRDQKILSHYQEGPAGPRDNHKSEQTQEERPGIPPAPGPQYPPPPPGGPHHFPPSKYPPPPPGPPPPQPFPRRPDDHRRRPCGRFPKFDRRCPHHHHESNDTACKREESGSSEEQDSFIAHHSFHRSSVDLVHHVPILSEHDVLQAPGTNFFDHPLPDHGRHGKHIIQPFPDVSSGAKSCPGKPKYDLLPGFLSLFPTPSAH
ncbi:histidine-rich glycoprotein [Ahaetulla prasina]|uniref:histidine-rich glycoprotein n=1 Tax=Ahaetulla prasina TaxID=499056 RepID=UPI0026481C8B|nr:histidine-rich glycoprotein [Ahaetulla prasina]